MTFENINFLSAIIFFGIFFSAIFLLWQFFLAQKKFNKIFPKISSERNFFLKYFFLFLSLFFLLFGIFEFKFGEVSDKNSLKGVDIIFALDVSKSMNSVDISDKKYSYTRLDSAKKAIGDFVVKSGENRLGLVIFSGDAIGVLPLTTDKDVFLTFLENVDYKNLTNQGTDIEKALSLSSERFKNEDRSKVVILVSDGGDLDYSPDLSKIKKIKKSNKEIHFFLAGIGTKKGGKILLGEDVFGRVNYQTYKGRTVQTSLNETSLKDISVAVGGEYQKISSISDILNFNKFLEKLDKKILEIDGNGEKNDGSRILGFISFLFFVLFLIFDLKIFNLVGKRK